MSQKKYYLCRRIDVEKANFDDAVLYPNPYVTITLQGYAKHYYTNGELVETVFGEGGWCRMSQDVISTPQSQHEWDLTYGLKEISQNDFPFEYSNEPESDRTNNVNINGVELSGLQYDCPARHLHHIQENSETDLLYKVMEKYCQATDIGKEVYFRHSDHIGSASWITDYNGQPIQYMHYAPYGQLIANQQATGYDERYKFTGKERDAETGYDYFGARYYMPLLYHWTKVDPLVDDYLHISPYAYCNWNPIKFVDPDGEWVAVTSNDDSGTSYKIVGGTVDVGDCNVYVVGNDYDMDRDGKPQGATVLGQTVTPYSFSSYNKETRRDEFAIGSIINMNDKSGDSFIARFQNDEVPLAGYVLPPILSNVSGWPGGGSDFKYGDDANRGMPLTILGGKIGTARDIGNFAAGFLAASKGFTGKTTRKVFDVFQNLTTPGCTTGEPPVSWWAQQLGHDYGRAARFANRVCQPNIYNAYH